MSHYNPILKRDVRPGEVKQSCATSIGNVCALFIALSILGVLAYGLIKPEWGQLLTGTLFAVCLIIGGVLAVGFVVARVLQALWSNGPLWSYQWRGIGWLLILAGLVGLYFVIVAAGPYITRWTR